MIRKTVLDGEPAIEVDTEEEFDQALGIGVWVIAPPTADMASWHLCDEDNTDSLEDVLAASDPDRRGTSRQTPQAGLSGVCGPGSKVEQRPVPIALQEPIEPLRELPSGLRVLGGAGEHPGPREDLRRVSCLRSVAAARARRRRVAASSLAFFFANFSFSSRSCFS